MIYKISYFKKELRQAYTENKIGNKRKLAFGLFIGLASFALYFIFQTLQESVLFDVLPEILQPSFFSTLYIYIHIAFVMNTAYFIIYYDYLFFSEIRKNSWYLLVQMGYNPASMIFFKLLAFLYSVFLVYTVGFAFTIFLTFFLKYTLVIAYMPALYIVGLTDLILVAGLAMTISLYAKTTSGARHLTFFSAIFIIALQIALGHYTILSNRVSMQNIGSLFDFSRTLFLPAAAVIVAGCGAVCVAGARNVAKYYNLSDNYYVVPPGLSVVFIDPDKGSRKAAGTGGASRRRGMILDFVFTSILTVFICAALVFNAFIIFINSSARGGEVAIRGVIPLIFKSDTMKPTIMTNDLAYFRKVDPQYEVKTGEIILFDYDNVVFVERVIEKTGNELKVDIDNYPPMSQPKAMLKTVQRRAVHGVYDGRNRWLGALILFSNTIIGRVLFLLLPAVLLFYQKQITGGLKRKK